MIYLTKLDLYKGIEIVMCSEPVPNTNSLSDKIKQCIAMLDAVDTTDHLRYASAVIAGMGGKQTYHKSGNVYYRILKEYFDD